MSPPHLAGRVMQWIISALASPIFGTLLDGYKAKLEAVNSQDKLAVDLAVKEIDAEIAARAEASKIMLIENGRWWTAAPRAIVQWSCAVFAGKCIVWDTVLGLGS